LSPARSKETDASAEKAPQAPVVPAENPASYNPARLWRDPPWGDTYYCEQCSTCMRFRYSGRMGGRVCVTSFNFNFPLVIIEAGRCNEYRPVPGAESLWTEDYDLEEEEAYDREEGPRRREELPPLEDDRGEARRTGARRRPRRRPRRSGPGTGGGGQAPV